VSTHESSTPVAAPGVETRALDVEHRRDADRAIVVSAVGLALTGGIELALALVTNSVGLLSDALHNLADVSTSAVVFIGFRISKKSPSPRYPYGLNRAEDLAGLGVAVVIWVSAAIAGFESYRKLVNHGETSHLAIGMIGAVIGIIGNQAVAWYKGRVGRRIHSATLVADAKHSWLDALSSVGALVGLAAVALGHWWGDPVAGFAVTLFIIHVGYEITSEMGHRLLDGIDPDLLRQAEQIAASVPGVYHARALGRWAGRSLTFDVDIYLDEAATVAEADAINRQVRDAIAAQIAQAHVVRTTNLPDLSCASRVTP
jgi:cation diffusion facilitator family transporter